MGVLELSQMFGAIKAQQSNAPLSLADQITAK